jgi:hypothetical protein
MTIRKRTEPARAPQAAPPETNAVCVPTANRSETGSLPVNATQHPETGPVATNDARPAGRTSRPPGPRRKLVVSRLTPPGSKPTRAADPVSPGIRHDRADSPAESDGPDSRMYRIEFHSVVGGLMCEDGGMSAELRGFESARKYAVENLEDWAAELKALAEVISKAEGFDDLDLGRHSSLLEECGDWEG